MHSNDGRLSEPPTGKLSKLSNGDPGQGVFDRCQTPHGMHLLVVSQQKLYPLVLFREPVHPARYTLKRTARSSMRLS